MTTIGLIPSPRPTAVKEGVVTDKVRTLIAEYLYVDMESVTDETHFADDLGADWVDCVDLMIAIEEFAGVQIADDDLDRIVTVGDLIRYIEAAVCLTPKRKLFAGSRIDPR
jgi:acyl carrier protein